MSMHIGVAEFKDYLLSKGSFSDSTWQLLESVLENHEIARGTTTLREGQTCRFIDFIATGSFRMYYNKDGEEVTTALFPPGQCMTDMKSLSQQTPSLMNLVANENSVVVRIYKDKLIALYDQSPELQVLGRTILESMLINESAWKEMYTLYDPTERYEFLIQKAPELIRRFPLQHIASFLGMRRETLSRIRASKTSK